MYFTSLLKENISEEIRDLTAKDIGQNLGTLGIHMGHCRHCADIEQTLGRNWEDIGQTLGRHWEDIGKTLGILIQDKTFRFSYQG
jgi:hypothetical protein